MVSVNTEFTDLDLISDNTLSSLFDTTLTHSYSKLLYVSTESFDSARGSGVWCKPINSGQFAYIAGRPYKYNHTDLSINMEKILVDGMNEVVGVDDNTNKNTSLKFELSQNYPNPFNPSTTIKYSIPIVETMHATSQLVTLKVYDILGREVATLVNTQQIAGNYEVTFDATNLVSGIYFYKLQSGSFFESKKMLLLK